MKLATLYMAFEIFYSLLKLMAKTVGFDTSLAHQSKQKCVSPENGTESVMKEMI